jgi:hypothetical protein
MVLPSSSTTKKKKKRKFKEWIMGYPPPPLSPFKNIFSLQQNKNKIK